MGSCCSSDGLWIKGKSQPVDRLDRHERIEEERR